MAACVPLDALVVAGSGFVGRRLVDQLGNARCVATYRSRPFPGGVRFDPGRQRLADLATGDARRFTHVFILYAVASPDACARDPAGTARVNVDSTIALAADAMAAGIVPVFVSSDYVFDGTRGGWRESDAPAPGTVYGAHKRAVEAWLERSGAPYLIVRLSKVVSGDARDNGVIGPWIDDIRAGRVMRCAMDQFFSPALVDDIAGAMIRLAEAGATGLYHLAGPERVSRLALAQMLVDQIRIVDPGLRPSVVPCSLQDLPFAEPRPLDTSLDTSKLQAAIGWRCKSMRELCAEAAVAHFARPRSAERVAS